MDEESKHLLQGVLELTGENNKMLHKIRGVQKREAVWHTLKILVILAVMFGSFYYIEPYLNKVMDLYNSVTGIEEKMSNNPLKNLLGN